MPETTAFNGIVFRHGRNNAHVYRETIHNGVAYIIFQNYGDRWWWVCVNSGKKLRTLNISPYRVNDDWLEPEPDAGDRVFDPDYWMERVSRFIKEGKKAF